MVVVLFGELGSWTANGTSPNGVTSSVLCPSEAFNVNGWFQFFVGDRNANALTIQDGRESASQSTWYIGEMPKCSAAGADLKKPRSVIRHLLRLAGN
ncbi:hypothetical protein T265_11696 [Opisthorchis viverrini]|uniref:Uncharacterized protein n=1 Tax=Opisthorchis viverrini TaxID=6198 RepID=A0A074ZWL5_OPIVI|nr:hypothetical protein T265_11696 [Opisthorchis viverrini]KER19574.1 hypothetical protein T265_11696 [Opisthorchis viverrini]